MSATPAQVRPVRGTGALLPRLRRVAARMAVVAAACVAAVAAVAHGGLPQLEAEFEAAVAAMDVATVIVVPAGGDRTSGCSGVLVTPTGLILTTDAAGRSFSRQTPSRTDDVEVRVPDPATKTFVNHKGKVVARNADAEVAIVRITQPPAGGFKAYLRPAESGSLRPGSFAFIAGNSFGMSAESTPTLTAGIVAAVKRNVAPSGAASGGTASGGTAVSAADPGLYEWIFTTAAVNPGVSGGPVVDARGRLVGLASKWVDAVVEPASPFQFLGRVTPMDGVRHALRDAPEFAEVFAAPTKPPLAAEESRALESVFATVAQSGSASVASLQITRTAPVSSTTLAAGGKPVDLPRYRGAVSAVVASEDGLLVTSLYNLTNLTTLIAPGVKEILPEPARLKPGLEAVSGATATFPDGTTCPAKLIAHHETLGIAVFRAELPPGFKPVPAAPAPPESFQQGRFAIVVASPHGGTPWPDPFLTAGLLSKKHADDAPDPWRGTWQTDARGTDGNCGGGVFDLRGRLLGVFTLWDVAQQGRLSGVSYVVPWPMIAAALPGLAAGTSVRRPFLGVQWADASSDRTLISIVVDGSAAKTAGLLPGDEIVEIDGTAVKTPAECMRRIGVHSAGDTLRLKVRRDGKLLDLSAVLGGRD